MVSSRNLMYTVLTSSCIDRETTLLGGHDAQQYQIQIFFPLILDLEELEGR